MKTPAPAEKDIQEIRDRLGSSDGGGSVRGAANMFQDKINKKEQYQVRAIAFFVRRETSSRRVSRLPHARRSAEQPPPGRAPPISLGSPPERAKRRARPRRGEAREVASAPSTPPLRIGRSTRHATPICARVGRPQRRTSRARPVRGGTICETRWGP